jgi:TAG lipase/steryl ester hydrolase/phospholipase A2/LPA acyltransferase
MITFAAMSRASSPATAVAGIPTEAEIKYKNTSLFEKTLDFCATAVRPAVGVVLDVSTHYAQRIYHAILSSRNNEKYYKMLIRKACSYEQFAAAGYMLDREKGLDEWKFDEKSKDYDYELVQDRLNILRTIRKNGDIPAMIFNLRTSLSRNLGDMGNPMVSEVLIVAL